ncbi:MAG: helix-turn-helix domain-containing protein [Clostridia bacterium]|nr:helix-turn-helix domain-containing protein [Clostridia bacterium]
MENLTKNSNWGGDMPELTQNPPPNIHLPAIVSQLTKAQRERLISGYDIKNFARIFEDADTMATVDCFLENGMNISATARILYMHRNTLIYRLNKIQTVTGLDIRVFDMAVTFCILRSLYEQK